MGLLVSKQSEHQQTQVIGGKIDLEPYDDLQASEFKIITSPFLRCVQTSAFMAAGLMSDKDPMD